MKMLQVIETVQELSDLFKEGKLGECKVIYETGCMFLQGTDEFVIDDKLGTNYDKFLYELFKIAGIPVYIT